LVWREREKHVFFFVYSEWCNAWANHTKWSYCIFTIRERSLITRMRKLIFDSVRFDSTYFFKFPIRFDNSTRFRSLVWVWVCGEGVDVGFISIIYPFAHTSTHPIIWMAGTHCKPFLVFFKIQFDIVEEYDKWKFKVKGKYCNNLHIEKCLLT